MVHATASGGSDTRVDQRTRDAFGFEWLRYPVTTPEEDRVTWFGLTGIEPSFYDRVSFRNLFSHEPTAADVAASTTGKLAGKTVVEAGCGMGKYVAVVAQLEPTLAVGLDASDAVERAVEKTRHLPNALIVQGDIFRPPLRDEFDLAYSVGVLHHTSDPRKAFLSTATLVRPDGTIAVWLYPHAETFVPQLIEFVHERILRPLTSKLPHRMLEQICSVLGRMSAFKTRLIERGGWWRIGLARTLNLIAVGEHVDPQIAAFLNFDWYSPPYRFRHTEDEVREWYSTAGFGEPRLLPVRVSAIGRREPAAEGR